MAPKLRRETVREIRRIAIVDKHLTNIEIGRIVGVSPYAVETYRGTPRVPKTVNCLTLGCKGSFVQERRNWVYCSDCRAERDKRHYHYVPSTKRVNRVATIIKFNKRLKENWDEATDK